MEASLRRLTLAEWQSCSPKDEPALRGLYLDQPGTADLAARLNQDKCLGITELRDGLAIESTSFVGKINLGPLELTIQPKIARMPLMALLRYAFGLRELDWEGHTSYRTRECAFQELLAQQLAVEVEELLHRGLQRTYQARSESLAAPRGRIDMQQLALRNSAATMTLPCVWHPRSEDCLANQIVYQGLLLAVKATEAVPLRSKLHRLAATLSVGVSPVPLDWRILRRYHRESNRLLAAYAPAITLIELLMNAQGAALEAGQADLPLPGFLFDMNLFFEQLIGRFLQEHLDDAYTVQLQFQLRGLFAYEPQFALPKRMNPTPRPDYAIMKGGVAVALLDAKYRDLWEKGLSRDMLYQLSIYALSGADSRQRATIIYPTSDRSAREARIQILHPLSDTPIGHVILRPVHLERLAMLLERPDTNERRRERSAFARELAFGEGAPTSGNGRVTI